MSRSFDVVAFTRQRHPRAHASFVTQSGSWPVHCVDESEGARFHPDLFVPSQAVIVDTGVDADEESADGFHRTSLGDTLRDRGITRVAVGGLGGEHGVRSTVLGSLREGFETWVIVDASAEFGQPAGEWERSLLEMRRAGAAAASAGQMETLLVYQPHPTALIIVDMQNDFFPGGAVPIARAPQALALARELVLYQGRRGRP